MRRRRRTIKHEYRRDFKLSAETKRNLSAIFFFTFSAIFLLSFFNMAGSAGQFIDNALSGLLGQTRLLLILILFTAGIFEFFPDEKSSRTASFIGLIILFFAAAGLLQTIHSFSAKNAISGGYIGLIIGEPFLRGFGKWATVVIFTALTLVGLILTANTSLENLAARGALLGSLARFLIRPIEALKNLANRPSAPRILDGGEEIEIKDSGHPFITKEIPLFKNKKDKVEAPKQAISEPPSPNREFSEGMKRKAVKHIDIPIDLLSEKNSKPTSGDIKKNMDIIEKTLQHFGIAVEMGDVSVGPTVTQFTFKPQEGIKLVKITSLANDLALALAAHPIRIEAPIPGKSLVGIEVPNQTVATVGLRELLLSSSFQERKDPLYLALGKDVSGHSWFADLPRLPHILVAGATGSGKTVCLNAMIVSLLYQNSPDDLKLILVDPKRVELPAYNGIPHLLVPTITDVPKTINAFRWAIAEMERRFGVLEKAGARDISSYNAASEEKMPAIVIIVDELADLMATAARDIESGVIRIAQMARAVGIHLILATQRPSVDVITGLIKANIPARIAFSVASQTDSRTILDTSGAEKLLGRGDMLFTSPEISKPKRIQGAFVADSEIKRVVNYLKTEYEAPEYNTAILEKPQLGSAGFNSASTEDGDPLLGEAKDVILAAGKASASLLQRRLKVGYARAARLLDLLEAEGFIGPGDGAKPREVLATGALSTVFSPSAEVANEITGSPSATEDEEKGDENDVPPWE